ncbi:early lactation protein [Drosophila novamexicana]|uniref:early lactation protein n=1 Tax=Drosophila novamexicana TaxID=47314 RepID=UPI0011E5F317|nr:early lactation protein [Drosophila novamexicana]
MCYKLSLIALSVLISIVCVHSAAVDQTHLVVEKQQLEGQTTTDDIDATSVPEQCHQPKETGRCFALFYRFAYNLDTHACEEFVYGGCAGNSNNFETKEQCEQLCLGISAPSTAASATEQSTELTAEQQQAAETTTSSANQPASD